MAALPPRPGAGTRFYPPAISEKNNSLFFSIPVSSFVKRKAEKKLIKFLTNPAVMEFSSPLLSAREYRRACAVAETKRI
jgi:hypothetical protein